jgi:hypothetical protein
MWKQMLAVPLKEGPIMIVAIFLNVAIDKIKDQKNSFE